MPPIHGSVDAHPSDAENCPGDHLGVRGRGATTTGALVQNIPMPPGLGGVWRPLVALILS